MIKNIFKFDPAGFESSDEIFSDVASGGNFRIERVVSKKYSNGKWYCQSEDELVFLLEGSAVLEFESGELARLERGDYILIKKFARHRVKETSENPRCVWLALFSESVSE